MSSAGDKTSVRVLSQTVDHAFSIVVICDVEVDLTDPKLNVKLALKEVPLRGNWEVVLKRVEGDVQVQLWYDRVAYAQVGTAVTYAIGFSAMKDGVALVSSRSTWPTAPFPNKHVDGDPFIFSMHRVLFDELAHLSAEKKPYRIWFAFEQKAVSDATLQTQLNVQARRLSGFHLEQSPSQLRLFFPNVGKDGAELWVNSDLLVRATPYFKDLLSSDFAEATLHRSKRARKSGAQPLPALATNEKDFDDSDDETDTFLLKTKPPKASNSTEASEQPFHEITITQTSFSTYHALLVYLETGYIRFAPLCSACSPSNPSPPFTREDLLSEHFEDNPSLPFPISPKSMFRLADLLRLPDEDPLYSLCLRAFSDFLTHHGAALELFGQTSVCFDKIRKVALEYVVKNWDAVSEMASWKEKMDEIQAGEIPEAAGIMVELMRAREEDIKKKLAVTGKA